MRGRRLRSDLAINIVMSAVKVAGLLWVIREAGMIMTPVALGVFLLARRVANTGACFLQLGMSQALVRYLAMYRDDPRRKRQFVGLSAFTGLLLALLLIPILLFLEPRIGPLLLPGAGAQVGLAFWTGMLMLGSVAHYLAHSTLIGERRMFWGGVLEFAAVSGILLFYFLWVGSDASPLAAVRFQSLCMLVLAIAYLVGYLAFQGRKSEVDGIPLTQLRDESSRFFLFALPRGLVTFLDMALLMLGPWLLRFEVEEAGFLIVSLTLVRVLQVAIMPVSQIASVLTAQYVGRGDERSIEEGVKLLFGAVLYSGALIGAGVIPWGRTILELWLGDADLAEGVFKYFIVVGWGLIPYALFQGLKGIIEMRWFRPLNMVTLIIANLVHLGAFLVFRGTLGTEPAVRWSFLLSLICLGVLTAVLLRRYLQPWSHWGLGRIAVVSIFLWGSNYVVASEAPVPLGLVWLVVSVALSTVSLWKVFPAPFLASLESFLVEAMGRRERAVW